MVHGYCFGGAFMQLLATDFAIDWMASFIQTSVDNIGHAHGRDISPEQNAALGRIIERARLDAKLPQAATNVSR